MSLFQELRARRVPQITSGYVVGCWGLLQFLAFLESRMAVSPHLVNLAGLVLLSLLPTVVTLAWVHGRPGRDTWGRAPKLVVPANLVAAVLVVFFVFQGRDLGAVTETINVEDENGAITERVVPRSAFRRRVLVFYPTVDGPTASPTDAETCAYLLTLDLGQDIFVDPLVPFAMVNSFRDAGSDDGHGVPRPLQRKLTRDANLSHFLTGVLTGRDGQWELATELHEIESGDIVARTVTGGDLFAVADACSRQLREDMGLPAAHLAETADLPVAELSSGDAAAVASHVQAVRKVTFENDWAGAVPLLEDAVARDPRYALAQFLLFGVRQTLGDNAGAATAIAAAMENLYSVPERTGFMIKAQYYYNEKQDADKAVAVLKMWSRIYPDDVDAYDMLAMFAIIRQDLPDAVAAYERILAIDPTRVKYMKQIADLQTQLGQFDRAEDYLRRYIAMFPTRADGYEELSDFFSTTGRLEEAREALAEAQLLEPENRDLALSLIDLDIKAGRYEATSRQLTEMLAQARTPRDQTRIHARQMNLAGLQGHAGDLGDRLADFHRTVLEYQNPLQANLVYSMALPALSQAGRPDEALARLETVKAEIPAPYNQLVGVGQAWVYADLGDVPQAREVLAQAVTVVETFKFETFRPSIALIEGMIAEAAGDLEAAVGHFREANESAVQVEPTYQVRLARALRLHGDRKEAAEVLAKAMLVDPEHPRLQFELARLLAEQGKADEARSHLDRVLRAWAGADADFPPAREAAELAARLPAP